MFDEVQRGIWSLVLPSSLYTRPLHIDVGLTLPARNNYIYALSIEMFYARRLLSIGKIVLPIPGLSAYQMTEIRGLENLSGQLHAGQFHQY